MNKIKIKINWFLILFSEILIVMVVLVASECKIPKGKPTLLKQPDNQTLSALSFYGNWCGPGHGGYQDCCNGTRCSSCKPEVPWKVTKKCLEQCPPIDELDYSCALHDMCTFEYEKPDNFSCQPDGYTYCCCNCELVERVKNLTCTTWECAFYSGLLIEVFTHGIGCWYTKNAQLQCNGVWGYPINEFCYNVEQFLHLNH